MENVIWQMETENASEYPPDSLEILRDDLYSPRRRATIFVDREAGVRAERLGVIFVAQQTRERVPQLRRQRAGVGVAQLKESAPAKELRGDLAKIFHVRPDDDRLRVERRLQNVVSPLRDQASADEDDRSEPVEGGQLPDRVEEDHVGGLAIPVGR